MRLTPLPSTIAFVVNPAPRQTELNKGKRENDQEKHPRQRRRISHVQELESLVVEVQDIEKRGVVRSALGCDVRGGKNLEGADDSDDEIEEDNRRDHRNRDEIGRAH